MAIHYRSVSITKRLKNNTINLWTFKTIKEIKKTIQNIIKEIIKLHDSLYLYFAPKFSTC